MPAPLRPAALRGTVFRKRDVLAAGLLTTDALRSSAWRRLYRGVYVDAALPDSLGVRIRGARLLAPPSAAFSGRTAAFLHGATELGDIRAPVELSVPASVRFGPVDGLRIRRVALPESDVVVLRGWRCTSAVRTAMDIARWDPLGEAVAALDVLLARVVVGEGELREAADRQDGRGTRRIRRAVALSDGRSESQQESRLRVILALAGLFPDVQHTVRDRNGSFVARVDLAFVERKVAIEYDGYWHNEREQFRRDRQRLNRLVGAGWTVLHVTAADLRDPVALVGRIRALLVGPVAGN